MKRIKLVIAPWDFWVGFFWDRQKSRLYILPIPMFGVYIDFSKKEKDVSDNGDAPQMIRWIKGRLKSLENEVAKLQRDSHPPINLLPIIHSEVSKALEEHRK